MKLIPFTMTTTETNETMAKKQEEGEKAASTSSEAKMTDAKKKQEESSSSSSGANGTSSNIESSSEKKEEEKKGKEEGKGETTDTTSKKKRTADRQITQDNYQDENGDDDDNLDRNAPFSKASEEVLAKRRIIKVKRPIPSSTTAGSGSVSSNPFAATTLGASSATASTAATTTATTNTATAKGSNGTKGSSSNSPTKVFGSGTTFGGFGTAAASATGGGFGSSTGFGGGFGAASSSSSGFGAVAASSSFDKSSSGQKNETKAVGFGSSNFFSSATSSGFTFNLQDKKKDSPTTAKEDDDNDDGGGGGASSSNNDPVCKLPANYELTTGEEGEKHLHEVRCKTFQWGIITSASTNEESQSNEHATPSVKHSSNFENKITSSATDDEKDDGNIDGEAKAEEGWRELGVGPLKLLLNETTGRYRLVQRRESTPNGNAHKVILNLPVWKETKICTLHNNEKNYTLIAPGPDGLDKYLLKFKESEHASTFLDKINAHKELAISVYGQGN